MNDDDAARESHKVESIEQAPVPPADTQDTPNAKAPKPSTD